MTPRQRTVVLSRLQTRGRAAGELLDAMHADAGRLEDVALTRAIMAAIEFLDAARYAIRERILEDAGHAPPPHGHIGQWRVDYMTEAEADSAEAPEPTPAADDADAATEAEPIPAAVPVQRRLPL
jgi:hypothetical protein